MPASGILCITDTLQYAPKEFSPPKTSNEYSLHKSIGENIAIIKDLLETLLLLSYGDVTKNVFNHIAYILQKSRAQPSLTILPLPLILRHRQTPYPSPVIINHPSAPAPRVEPVV